MATLFELVDEYRQLYDLATEDGDPQALADTLEAWLPEIQQKASGYVNVIQRLDMEARKAKELADAFKAKQQARENSIKAMKNTLLMALDQMGMSEMAAGDFTIKIAKNGGKQPLVIDDESNIPDSMMKVIYEPDKELIRKALEEGQDLGFAHLEERGRNIRIK